MGQPTTLVLQVGLLPIMSSESYEWGRGQEPITPKPKCSKIHKHSRPRSSRDIEMNWIGWVDYIISSQNGAIYIPPLYSGYKWTTMYCIKENPISQDMIHCIRKNKHQVNIPQVAISTGGPNSILLPSGNIFAVHTRHHHTAPYHSTSTCSCSLLANGIFVTHPHHQRTPPC